MKENRLSTHLVSFVAGLLFAGGLGVAGMGLPSKVLGFLDFTGKWDASLGLVLGAATGVTFIAFRFILKRPNPILVSKFYVPTNTTIDMRLIFGAILFGIGWGISGFCPGPGLLTLMSGIPKVAYFFLALIGGNLAFYFVQKALESKKK